MNETTKDLAGVQKTLLLPLSPAVPAASELMPLAPQRPLVMTLVGSGARRAPSD